MVRPSSSTRLEELVLATCFAELRPVFHHAALPAQFITAVFYYRLHQAEARSLKR